MFYPQGMPRLSRTTLLGALVLALLAGAAVSCTQDVVDANARPTGNADGGTGTGSTDVDSGPRTIPGTDFDAAPPAPFDAGQATGKPPQDAECDLNGRWLVAQRILASAIGQDQASHNWFYLEVRHEGADLLVLKGLHCGFEVIKKTALGANVDSSGAWAGILSHVGSTGRKGHYAKQGTTCHLSLDKEYVVRGATLAYYVNPGSPLPTKTQQAAGTTPGWEDWDGDGNPGISLKVNSAVASGVLYLVQRDWTVYDGTTPLSAPKFKVSITYDGEQVALGRSSGSPQAIETTSAPSSDATQHYAWFQKLGDGQATGSDTDICAAVRTLKDSLVPEANQ